MLTDSRMFSLRLPHPLAARLERAKEHNTTGTLRRCVGVRLVRPRQGEVGGHRPAHAAGVPGG